MTTVWIDSNNITISPNIDVFIIQFYSDGNIEPFIYSSIYDYAVRSVMPLLLGLFDKSDFESIRQILHNLSADEIVIDDNYEIRIEKFYRTTVQTSRLPITKLLEILPKLIIDKINLAKEIIETIVAEAMQK